MTLKFDGYLLPSLSLPLFGGSLLTSNANQLYNYRESSRSGVPFLLGAYSSGQLSPLLVLDKVSFARVAPVTSLAAVNELLTWILH